MQGKSSVLQVENVAAQQIGGHQVRGTLHALKRYVQRARENLQAVGAKILGAVINRIDPRGSSGYYYASYYSTYYYHKDGKDGGSTNGKAPSGIRKLLGRGKNGNNHADASEQ